MTQGNTCTYINDLTNNIKSGYSISSSECLTSQYTHWSEKRFYQRKTVDEENRKRGM